MGSGVAGTDLTEASSAAGLAAASPAGAASYFEPIFECSLDFTRNEYMLSNSTLIYMKLIIFIFKLIIRYYIYIMLYFITL
jgi:hypothetical protein